MVPRGTAKEEKQWWLPDAPFVEEAQGRSGLHLLRPSICGLREAEDALVHRSAALLAGKALRRADHRLREHHARAQADHLARDADHAAGDVVRNA